MKTLSRNELKSLQGGKFFGQGLSGDYDPQSCHFTTVGGPSEVICVCNWEWCHYDFWVPNHCQFNQPMSTNSSACFANSSTVG